MTQSKQYKVAILPGDGIGPETVREAVKVLEAIETLADVAFELVEAPFGAAAYFAHGHPFPQETRALCTSVDAVLKGPVGLSHEEAIEIPVELQPERGGVVPLRRHLDLVETKMCEGKWDEIDFSHVPSLCMKMHS